MAALDPVFKKMYEKEDGRVTRVYIRFNGKEYDIDESYDEFGKPKMSISCSKRKTPVHIVKKPGGSVLYCIKVEKEEVPQVLSGGYTRIETAMDAVIRYLDKAPMTQSIKSELLAEEREKRKKAKAAS
jgi:hypothetical protein